MKTAKIACLFCCSVCFGFEPKPQATATLVQIPQSSFGSNSMQETFNEPPDYSNATDSSDTVWPSSMVLPGTYNNYTFTNTGISLTAPIPNVEGDYMPDIMVIDSTYKSIYLGAYGPVYESDIPGGSWYLIQCGSSQYHFAVHFDASRKRSNNGGRIFCNVWSDTRHRFNSSYRLRSNWKLAGYNVNTGVQCI